MSLFRGAAHFGMSLRQQQTVGGTDSRPDYTEIAGRVEQVRVPTFPAGKQSFDFVS
jgi:hypothetical protein